MNLEEIRRVTQQATPGPWAYHSTGEQDTAWAVGVAVDPGTEEPIAGDLRDWEDEHGEAVLVELVAENAGFDARLANAEFIALAREAIPWLLDRIDQLVGAGDSLGGRLKREIAVGVAIAGYHTALADLEEWGRAKFAVCERTETARTPLNPSIQADAR